MIEYQREPDWIAEIAWSRTRPYLTALELFRIAAWKSAKGLGWLTLNSEEEIRSRTATAMEHIAAWRGSWMVGVTDLGKWAAWREVARSAIGAKNEHSGLLGLHGVEYPMATAILAVLDPNVWPVMDKWAVKTVFGPSPKGGFWPARRWQRAVAYEIYARHLANAGAERWAGDLSIHDLDQKAMRAAMKNKKVPSDWKWAALPSSVRWS